ncbi:C_GCAxxG_C_C family protein [Alicyclobacillaceae bacterium I2511]|nr:C_GCAxxG_C_C family protein [Alicyclobacillaceae bacterium I2511]
MFGADKTLFKIADGFSGGIAVQGTGLCGALAGSIMVISYFFGRDYDHRTRSASEFRARELVRQFRKRFDETFQGETCPIIQNYLFGKQYRLDEPQEKKAFEKDGAHTGKCNSVVGTASLWLAELLVKEGVLQTGNYESMKVEND